MSVSEIRESWLLARAQGLGGTDAAAIVGLSPWRKPIDVFASKTGQVSFGTEITEAMHFGNLLEPVIRQEYSRRAQIPILSGADIAALFPQRSTAVDGQTIVSAEDRPWMLGTPDGIARSGERGLEIKNVGYRGAEWGPSGSDEIPDHYAIQVQWYMAVTGIPVWDVAPLFSGNRLETFRVERNDALIRELIEACEQFWHDHVLKGVPPPVDESASYGRYLAQKFSLANGEILPATEEITTWALSLREAQNEIATAEKKAQLAKNYLGEMLGAAVKTEGEFGSVRWIRSKESSRTDWEAVAKTLGAPDDLVAAHTSLTRKEPYIQGYWKKEK